MAFAGSHSLSSQTLATLSPIKPRKVCIAPTSFQWRARQSWHHPQSTLTSRRHGVLLAPNAVKRQFSWSAKRCRGSGVGDEGSFERPSLSQANQTGHTAENGRNREQTIPEFGNPTIAVNGTAVVNRGTISTEVLKTMRTVPQPVTIITSTDISTGKPIFRGATISSFNTVTIEPTTIVSLNIKRPSSTFDAIASSGYFLVHLLSATRTNSELAQAFTKGTSHAPFETLEGVSQIRLSEDSGQVEELDAGPPVIRCPSPGHLLCRYHPDKTVEVGDHVVIFGTVDSVTEKRDFPEESNTACLVYANGHYGRVSPLELSSTLKITRTAFDDFVLKIKLMDHSSLGYFRTPFSGIYLDRMTPELSASFKRLRSSGKRLVDFILRNKTFNFDPNPFSTSLGTRKLSSLSNGILEAVTFHLIFLDPKCLTTSVTSALPQLPSRAVEEFQKYQVVATETRAELVLLRGSLHRLYDPEIFYQPLVSDVYSLENVPPVSLGEKFRYLSEYVRWCLPPIGIPQTKRTPGPVLALRMGQYNVARSKTSRWLYDEVARSNKPFASQPIPARAQARAAVLNVPRKAILISRAVEPTTEIQRPENIAEEFRGLDDELMASLRRYSAICETTARYLHDYKAFLHASALYISRRIPLGRSEEVDPVNMMQSTVRRKRFGRNATTPRIHRHTTKLRSLVKKYVRSDWIKPRILRPTTEPSALVEQYIRNFATGSARRVRVRPVARKLVLKASPKEPAEDEIKVKFIDPLARRVDRAERRKESIKGGLEYIDKLMAGERLLRQGEKTDSQRVVSKDRESPKTEPKPSKLVNTADWFFEVMGGESKVVR